MYMCIYQYVCMYMIYEEYCAQCLAHTKDLANCCYILYSHNKNPNVICKNTNPGWVAESLPYHSRRGTTIYLALVDVRDFDGHDFTQSV